MALALITGATSGFGKATAEKFAAAGYRLIITGRRREMLEETATFLRHTYSTELLTLVFDVGNREAVRSAIATLPMQWQQVDVLINNAGLALGREYFDEADIDDWDTMIDTNVKGLLYMSRAILPFMIAAGSGHIINIGSIAGKEVYEKGNVYCASKHTVDAISASMRIDLLRHRIKVTAVHPGAAETEFSKVRFKGNEDAANAVYQGFTPLKAEDVADVVYYCATLPAHVCINELTVMPTAQANAFYFFKEG